MKEQLLQLIIDYLDTYRVKRDAEEILGMKMRQIMPILNGKNPSKLETLITLCERIGYKITLTVEKANG